MDNLEKFIGKNRDLFDDEEPLDGHFERFEERLDQVNSGSDRSFDRYFMLMIAAGLLILLTISVFIFDFGANRISRGLSEVNTANVPNEIQEAINYYDAAASNSLKQINKLACCGQDTKNIYSMANEELKTLNANSEELQRTLQQNPDERVKAALIQNNMMKEQVINELVNQMKRR